MQRAGVSLEIEDLQRAFVDAQLAGDARAAIVVIERGLAAGHDATVLRRELVRGGQETMGRLWEENRLGVAREHMATSVALVALDHLYWRAPTPHPRGRRVVVSCVEGEQHGFPARLAADTLDLAGYEIRYLGADVPRDALVAMVRDETPDLVALSVTLAAHLPELERTVARLREAVPDVPIVIGGAACASWAGIAARLGVIAAGRTAEDLLATANSLFGEGR